MKENSFDFEQPQQSSGFLLWQVTTLWQRKIKTTLETMHLSHSGFVLLASLLWFKEQKIEVTQTTLIKHSKLDKMTVSKSLKILEKNLLLIRSENKKDTRAKTITLTNKGIQLVKKAIVLVEDTDKDFFSNLNIEEIEQLNKLFIKITQGENYEI